MLSFHQSHFSAEGIASFSHGFTNLSAKHQDVGEQNYDGAWEDEQGDDDDLGYYEDGVKRTLTDEQIEIFRQCPRYACASQASARDSGS